MHISSNVSMTDTNITFDLRGNEREKRAHFPPKPIISFYPKSERE